MFQFHVVFQSPLVEQICFTTKGEDCTVYNLKKVVRTEGKYTSTNQGPFIVLMCLHKLCFLLSHEGAQIVCVHVWHFPFFLHTFWHTWIWSDWVRSNNFHWTRSCFMFPLIQLKEWAMERSVERQSWEIWSSSRNRIDIPFHDTKYPLPSHSK